MPSRTAKRARRLVPLAIAALALAATPVAANETDQYTLPIDKPFADLGPYFDAVHYEVLSRAVDLLNEQLRPARFAGDQGKIDYLTSPGAVADAVRGQFMPGFIETLNIERAVRTSAAKRAYPDQYTAYKTLGWIYAWAHLPIDPRRIPLLVQSSTVRVHGSYFGTDKMAHFHDLGHYYFKSYLARMGDGDTPEEARKWVVWWYSRGPISETLAIGSLATGVISNADLASNYAGMKFYENLTAPVTLKGQDRPPLLILRDGYWRLNFHVRPDSGFMEPFFSDHFNEALNPNVFEIGMRGPIKRHVRKIADQVLQFYADADGNPRTLEWFHDQAVELRTLYGEDYGAYINEKVMFTIGDLCLAPPDEEEAPTESPPEESASEPPPEPATLPDVKDVTPTGTTSP
ncbi:MAG: hypothetical protein R3B57_10900 [Phycisphaerales bacterium]